MILDTLALASLAIVGTNAAAMHKRSSNSWAGANNYFVQGLSSDAQDSYFASLASSGAKVVRVWVNAQPGGNACEKGSYIASSAPDLETTIGQYNSETMDLLDVAMNKLASHGLKALISPHDANVLGGDNPDIYGKTYGSGDFYNDPNAAQQYDARLSYILNYVGSAGVAYKDWSDVIMGFDIQNEPFTVDGKASYGDPNGWLCGRAGTLRSLLGSSSPIRIGTGGIGGDYSNGYTFASFATGCADVDMISMHRYADNGWDESTWLGQTGGKLLYVEEWGVDGSSQGSEYASNTDTLNSQGLPWMYWEILPPYQCDSSDSDQFGIYQGGSTDIASPMQAAANSPAAQDWTGIIY